MSKFDIGKSYYCYSSHNEQCKWIFEVISRSNTQVTIKDMYGKICKRKAYQSKHSDNEILYPIGKYAAAPILVSSVTC